METNLFKPYHLWKKIVSEYSFGSWGKTKETFSLDPSHCFGIQTAEMTYFILHNFVSCKYIFTMAYIIHCTSIVKINTAKIRKILEAKINLSVFKFTYLGQFVSDLNKLGSKISIRVLSIKIKRKFDN